MSDTMHSVGEQLFETQNAQAERAHDMAVQNARAEEILREFGQFAAAAAAESDHINLQELYAGLGLATAVCIESAWSVAGTAQMDRAYEALRRAQERLKAPPAEEKP